MCLVQAIFTVRKPRVWNKGIHTLVTNNVVENHMLFSVEFAARNQTGLLCVPLIHELKANKLKNCKGRKDNQVLGAHI